MLESLEKSWSSFRLNRPRRMSREAQYTSQPRISSAVNVGFGELEKAPYFK